MEAWGRGMFGALLSLLMLADPSLPPSLQKDLDELRSKLEKLESRIPDRPVREIEQSLAEAKQWIDEFALDAELLETDPLLKDLQSRLDQLKVNLAEVEKARMAKANDPKSKTSSEQLEELLKVEVDLKAVSFKRDVAPIIADSCLNCHNTDRMEGDFSAATYESFISNITPGDAKESHILKLVTGRSQPRMPRGNIGFARESVDIWTAWVEQGAKFDGPDEATPITKYLVSADAKRRERISQLSPGDLHDLRHLALDRQRDILKPIRPVSSHDQSAHFLVRTTLPAEEAEYVATLAEAVLEDIAPKYASLTKKSSPHPILGEVTGLWVWRDRHDYVAFAQQIDGYSPEPHEFGHFRTRPELSYIALTSEHEGASLDLLVAQQVLGVFFQRLGEGTMPDWAVYGNARHGAMAWDLEGASSVKSELEEAGRLIVEGRTLDQLIADRLPWVESAPLAVSIITFMAQKDQSLRDLNEQLAGDDSSREKLWEELAPLAEAWRAWATKKVRGKR